jgi:hypothetical protein
MGINFDPAKRPPGSPEIPEKGPDEKKEQALRMIGRLYPHENLENLYLVPAGEIEGGSPDSMLFCRPQDTDKRQEERFFQVLFKDGQAESVRSPKPVTQTYDDAQKGKPRRFR